MFVLMARSRRLRAARKSGLFVLTWAFATAASGPHDVRQEQSGGGDDHASSDTGKRHDNPGERVPQSGPEKPLAAPSQSSSPPGPLGVTPKGASGVPKSPAESPAESPEGSPPRFVEDGAETDEEIVEQFRQELRPYGVWVEDPRYGRVWVPDPASVGHGFSPYVSHGRWGIDEAGQWIWLSDLPYGHVVFHYGRWVQVRGHGWAWIPGTRYAPAWVVWRVPHHARTTTYVGWAPAPPSFVWYGGVAYHYVHPVSFGWVFCPSPYVFDRGLYRHLVRDHRRAMAARDHTREHAPSRPRIGAPRSPTTRQAYVPPRRVPAERWTSPRVLARGARGTTAPRSMAPRAVPRRPAPRATVPRADRRVPTFGHRSRAPAVRPLPRSVPRAGSSPPRAPTVRRTPVRPSPVIRPSPRALPRGGHSRPAPVRVMPRSGRGR